jgi:hypothetical protein
MGGKLTDIKPLMSHVILGSFFLPSGQPGG